MTKMIVASRVGADGVLNVSIPLGMAEADRPVQLTIEAPPTETNRERYLAWLDRAAGAWQGEFERPPQDEGQERDPF